MKKPSDVEMVAMALEWNSVDISEENYLASTPKGHWRKLHPGRRAMWRKDARAFLQALRGGR